MAAVEFEEPKDMDEYLKLAKDPIVKVSNIVAEMRDDVVDIVVQFTEGKYASDYEKSSSVRGPPFACRMSYPSFAPRRPPVSPFVHFTSI